MMNLIRTAIRWAAAGLVAGTLLISSQAALAQESNEMERNRALIAEGMEAWAAGTGSPYNLLAEDVRWTIAGNSLGARTYASREAFMREVIRPFNARMRDRLIPSVHRYYVDGDTVIVHFDARGVARDGRPYENSYVWILRMDAGQIVEAHAYFDSIEFDDLWRRVTPAATE